MSPKQTGKSTVKKGKGRRMSPGRKISQHVLQKNELINFLPEAVIITDIHTNIIEWNSAAERLYGWDAGDVLGKPIEDFLHTQYQSTDREEAVATVLENGQWFNIVTQECKDSARIPVISSVSLIKNEQGEPVGYVGINRDYTRETANKRARQQSEAILMGLLDATPDVIIVINRKGEILLANRQVETVFGYPQAN